MMKARSVKQKNPIQDDLIFAFQMSTDLRDLSPIPPGVTFPLAAQVFVRLSLNDKKRKLKADSMVHGEIPAHVKYGKEWSTKSPCVEGQHSSLYSFLHSMLLTADGRKLVMLT